MSVPVPPTGLPVTLPGDLPKPKRPTAVTAKVDLTPGDKSTIVKKNANEDTTKEADAPPKPLTALTGKPLSLPGGRISANPSSPAKPDLIVGSGPSLPSNAVPAPPSRPSKAIPKAKAVDDLKVEDVESRPGSAAVPSSTASTSIPSKPQRPSELGKPGGLPSGSGLPSGLGGSLNLGASSKPGGLPRPSATLNKAGSEVTGSVAMGTASEKPGRPKNIPKVRSVVQQMDGVSEAQQKQGQAEILKMLGGKEGDFFGSDSDEDDEESPNNAGRNRATVTNVKDDRAAQDLSLWESHKKKHAIAEEDAIRENFGGDPEQAESEHEAEFWRIFIESQSKHDECEVQRLLAKERWEELQLVYPLLDKDTIEAIFTDVKADSCTAVDNGGIVSKGDGNMKSNMGTTRTEFVTEFPENQKTERMEILHEETATKKNWFRQEKVVDNVHMKMCKRGIPILHKNEHLRADLPGYFQSELSNDFKPKKDSLSELIYHLATSLSNMNKVGVNQAVQGNETFMYLKNLYQKSVKVMRITTTGKIKERWLMFTEMKIDILAEEQTQYNEESIIPYSNISEIFCMPEGDGNLAAAASKSSTSSTKKGAPPKNFNLSDESIAKRTVFIQSRPPIKLGKKKGETGAQPKNGFCFIFLTAKDAEVVVSALACLCQMKGFTSVTPHLFTADANGSESPISPHSRLGAGTNIIPPDTITASRKTYADGSSYLGEFSADGKRHGRGVLYTDACTFSGYWHSDLRMGPGEEQHSDGTCFQGLFENGEREGYGYLRWVDESEYQGIFHKGQAMNAGTLLRRDKSCYQGQFKEDCMQGHGAMVWGDGTKYEGQFDQNKRNGVGVMHWVGSQKWSRYFGEWRAGKQHGVGILILNSGAKCPGLFNEGQLAHWM